MRRPAALCRVISEPERDDAVAHLVEDHRRYEHEKEDDGLLVQHVVAHGEGDDAHRHGGDDDVSRQPPVRPGERHRAPVVNVEPRRTRYRTKSPAGPRHAEESACRNARKCRRYPARSCAGSNDELYSNVATTAYSLKRFNIAIQVINDKITQGKAVNADYFSLGKIYYQLKQYGKADTTFTALTKIDTGNVQAYLWIANSDFSMDPDSKLGIAKPKYEKVVEKGLADTVKYAKELFAAYDYLGSYYLTVKPVDLDKSARIYQKIIALDPNNKTWEIKGYSGLALIAAHKKNSMAARDLFKTLMTLDPGNKDFQKAEEGFDKQIKAQEAAANQ